jgi:peroxiredoxin
MDGSVISTLALGMLWALVVVHSLVLLGVVHVVHGLARQPMGRMGTGAFAIGQAAPSFRVRTLDGELVSSDRLSGLGYGLLFVSPTCESCRLTLSELRAAVVRSEGALFVICEGAEAECRSLLDDYGIAIPIVSDPLGAVRARFGIRSVPTAVVVDRDGRIASVGRPDRTDLGLAVPGAPRSRSVETGGGGGM